jgi:hypothetical protein
MGERFDDDIPGQVLPHGWINVRGAAGLKAADGSF